MKTVQNLGFKVNNQKNSRSKGDRINFDEQYKDGQFARKAAASYRHAKEEAFLDAFDDELTGGR